MSESKNNADGGLRAVELLLLWEGRLRNVRLRSMLGVHFTTASRLVAAYRELNPESSEYDQSAKSYVANPTMKPVLTDGAVEEYLALIDRTRAGSDAVARTHLDLGDVRPPLFSLFHRACEDGSAVLIDHGSMRHPKKTRRQIWPHTLVQAGRRWHVRAWCAEAAAFRDFALGRMHDARSVDAERPDQARPDLDEAWQTHVSLRLIAHPALSPEQQSLVCEEYFKGKTARVVKERAALLPYVIQELRAAVDVAHERAPAFQLAVAEPEALRRWLLPGVALAPDQRAD